MRLLLLALVGCNWSVEHRSRERLPHATHVGEGWALAVPEGAVVETADTDHLRVDAVDGSVWFDLRWIPVPAVPRIAATTWADEMCEGIRWDLPAEPVPGVWTVGGLCTIRGNRHWVLVSQEKRDDRVFFVGGITPFGALGWEDFWVEFVTSPLSLAAGSAPASTLDKATIRERVRKVDLPVGGATLPVPGGGIFSQWVSTAFADVWAGRAAQALPLRFLPEPAGATPEEPADVPPAEAQADDPQRP